MLRFVLGPARAAGRQRLLVGLERDLPEFPEPLGPALERSFTELAAPGQNPAR